VSKSFLNFAAKRLNLLSQGHPLRGLPKVKLYGLYASSNANIFSGECVIEDLCIRYAVSEEHH
jgi:hypothetical protein